MSNYPDKTTVFNRNDLPRSAETTYIGRGSIWGNPFKIGSFVPHSEPPITMGRSRVIIEYFNYFLTDTDLHKQLYTLPNEDGLVCYCAPKDCHGDVLAAFADAYRKVDGLAFAWNSNAALKIPENGFNKAIPHIADLQNPYLFYSNVLNDWEFSLESRDGESFGTGGNLYDVIRKTLDDYFQFCIKN